MTMMLYCKTTSTLLCAAIIFIDYVASLELIEFQVPTHVPVGIRAVLLCRWKLGPSEALYSIKWYKDGKEFFRHVPRDIVPIRKFLLPGVDVQEFNSSGSNLTLTPAVLATSGRYRCEVSGERPQFQTVSEYADMLVIALPSLGLNILGFVPQYQVGDRVNLTCLSTQSKPTVQLAWYINGKPAVPNWLYADDNRMTSSSVIEFIILESMVGNLTLQCLATAGSIYWRSIEKSAVVVERVEDKVQIYMPKFNTVLAYPTNAKSRLEILKQQYFFIVSTSIFLCAFHLISIMN